MFEDWSRSLSTLDLASVDSSTVRSWLTDVAALRAAVDAFEARAAVRLGDSPLVRGASRCTQREADRAVARGQLIDAIPEVGQDLANGAISGAHVDTLARAAEQTTVDDVAGSGLLAVARARPADAMNKQVSEFVRKTASDADLADRLLLQRRNRRAMLLAREMGVLHAEFDDTTFGEVSAAINAETDRLFRLDGGRDAAADVRTPQQRRADAIAGLLTRDRSGDSEARGSAGVPAVRNQMLVVAHTDGTGEIPGVGPLPRNEAARLACISDLYGVVFDGESRSLWHGRRVRLADDDQWRVLIARDGGCIGCGADPSRCEAHHVVWRRNGGPTDIDNLVLLCSHHHHLIHDQGWCVVPGTDGRWMLVPP